MCETRWVENHDGLLRFKEIHGAIPLLAISITEFVIA